MFIVSMVIGTIVGINIKGELFSKTKFFKAIFEALCYLMSIWFVNEMGRTYDDHDLSNQVIKYVTYLVTWAYSCSIFKNLKLLFPSSKPIAIIYDTFYGNIQEVKKQIQIKMNLVNQSNGTAIDMDLPRGLRT